MSPIRFHSLKALKTRIATSNYLKSSTQSRTVRAYKNVHLGRFSNCSDSSYINNIRQPYKSVLVLLVGRSHCAEAVDNLKEMAFRLARLVARQCKVHAGQKLQQSMQFYSFYSRMWGEDMTRKMISGMKKSLLLHGKRLILSATCLLPYDWDNNKISDQKLERSIEELNSVDRLCSATVYCQDCLTRQVIDKKLPNIDYCTCKGSTGYTNSSRLYESWEPFLERENILVWRRPNENYPHLFAYKVYGTYEDMSLSAFMEVQLNTEFRTEWDSTALELEVLSSHPESNSDLIYWRVKFPNFFANRDYVFKRRYKFNEKSKEVVIISELAKHDQIPEVDGIHRVSEYWSIMVLKANRDFYEPGMSFTLTYFDNPGTNLPAVVTSFIATTAFPDYLKRVYQAAIRLQHRWERGEDVYVTLPRKLLRCINPETKEAPTIFLPETDSKDVELFDVTRNQYNEKRRSQYEAIKDAFTKDKSSENDSLTKIPLKYKKAVVDLLEATEVVYPDLDEKTRLASKIEKLVDNLHLESAKKIQLLKRLSDIRLKARKFIEGSAKKKEESMRSMKEFETGRSYYEHADERTIFLIKGMFKAINEVLEMDKDMRIGKGLIKADNSAPSMSDSVILKSFKDNSNNAGSEIKVKNETVLDNDVENKKIHASVEALANKDNTECPCCACDKTRSTKSHWYSRYNLSSLWGSDNQSNNSFCDSCICNHKPKNSTEHFVLDSSDNLANESVPTSNNEVSSTEQNLNKNFSYWHYLYIWSVNINWLNFFIWPFSSNSLDEVVDKELTDSDVTDLSANESLKEALLGDKNPENSVSWYWLPVKASYNLIVWIFGISATKEPG